MIREQFNRIRSGFMNLHPFARVLVILVPLVLAVYPTAAPTYRLLKKWRVEHNLTAAVQAMDERRMQDARDLSLTVLQAGDPRIDALRILERSAAALGDSRHPDIASVLIVHPEGTDADRLTGLQGVVMDLPLGRLGQAWLALPEEMRKRPSFASAFARRLVAEGRLGEAIGVLMEVPEDQRDVEARQQLASVLIATGRSDGYEEAQRMIAAGVAGDVADATPAWLDLLEGIPLARLQPGLLAPVRGALDAMAYGDADTGRLDPARLELLRGRLALSRPGTVRKRILENAIDQWSEGAPEPLARLLFDAREDELLMETFATPQSPPIPGVARLVWRAAERQAEWQWAETWLEEHGTALPVHELAAYRAIIATRTGDSAAIQLAWSRALDAAGQSTTAHLLLEVHRIARDAGIKDAADNAMVAAIRKGRGPLPLYESQLPLVASIADAGRDTLVFEICAIYLALEPFNPLLLTQYAYLACLNDIVEPARLLPPLEALAEALPDELPIKSTLATVLMAAGRATEAAELLDPLGLAESEMSPTLRIILLTSDVLNDRIAPDDERVASFPWASLQNPERRKFTELIRRHTR